MDPKSYTLQTASPATKAKPHANAMSVTNRQKHNASSNRRETKNQSGFEMSKSQSKGTRSGYDDIINSTQHITSQVKDSHSTLNFAQLTNKLKTQIHRKLPKNMKSEQEESVANGSNSLAVEVEIGNQNPPKPLLSGYFNNHLNSVHNIKEVNNSLQSAENL